MEDTWWAILARRQVRAFTDKPITRAAIELVLEAGRRSPSARNAQPWSFVVVTAPHLARLAGAGPGAGFVAESAATVALVAKIPSDERRDMLMMDLGQAVFSITLAATDAGIGSGIARVRDEAVTDAVLGIPHDRFCPCLVALGMPADRPLAPIGLPDRRAAAEVVHWDQW